MRAHLPPYATARARNLRARQTEAENRLWYFLRDRRFLGAKFRRQVPVGPYVADFLCKSAGLIVEADGGQHSERAAQDGARTRFLEAEGYRVLRFWNSEVMENVEGVMEVIAMAIRELPSPPAPLPQAGEGSAMPSPAAPFPQAGEGSAMPAPVLQAEAGRG
jgi:very-short-patch-repair endonuclease